MARSGLTRSEALIRYWDDPLNYVCQVKVYRTPEFRSKMRRIAREQWQDPERRAKGMAAARSKWTEEHRAKIEGLWQDPERLAKQKARGKARWQDPAKREARAAAMRAKWQDPAYRERMLKAFAEARAHERANARRANPGVSR